jgi:hypothetical protein
MACQPQKSADGLLSFPPYEPGSVRELSRFLGLLCEAVHLHNLEKPVKIAADPVPEELWNEVIAESSEVLSEVRRHLQHYSLTPWRLDWTKGP